MRRLNGKRAASGPFGPELRLVNLTTPAEAAAEARLSRLNRERREKRGVRERVPVESARPVPSARVPKAPRLRLPSLRTICRRALVILGTILTVLVLSALMVAGYVHVTNSDLLLVRPETITVTGLKRVTRLEALRAGGLDRPRNLLTIDAGASMAAIGSLPWVERAELTRYFPDGVSVSVVEYKPKALVALGGIYYLDEAGRPFKRLDPGENPALPIISGLSLDDLMDGGPLVAESLAEVFRLMELLAARGDEFRLGLISEIHHDPDRGLTVLTRDGELEIKLGFGAFAEKLIRLGRVAAHLKSDGRLQDLEYLSLDCPPRVIGRYRDGRRRAAPEPAGESGRS